MFFSEICFQFIYFLRFSPQNCTLQRGKVAWWNVLMKFWRKWNYFLDWFGETLEFFFRLKKSLIYYFLRCSNEYVASFCFLVLVMLALYSFFSTGGMKARGSRNFITQFRPTSMLTASEIFRRSIKYSTFYDTSTCFWY